MQKVSKKSRTNEWLSRSGGTSCPFVRPTHMNSHSACNYIFYWIDRKKLLLRVVRNLWRRCSRLTFFNKKMYLVRWRERRWKNYNRRRVSIKEANHNYRRCRWLELFSTVNSSTKVKSGRPAMAVYHCRCAFLWFFLLHKQKKEQKPRCGLCSFFLQINKEY